MMLMRDCPSEIGFSDGRKHYKHQYEGSWWSQLTRYMSKIRNRWKKLIIDDFGRKNDDRVRKESEFRCEWVSDLSKKLACQDRVDLSGM
jgi:hypothetical protein